MRHLACLLAALALSACDKTEEPADVAADTVAAPVIDADWKRLGDGSFIRLAASPQDPDRREADRCWPAREGYECLGIDDIRLPVGRIVVANRTYVEELPATASLGARTGFSCAIYGGPVVEQRIIRDEAGLLINDSLDGALWSSGDVERLTGAAKSPPEGGYLDCTALASRIDDDLAVVGAADFDRTTILPPLARNLAPTAA